MLTVAGAKVQSTSAWGDADILQRGRAGRLQTACYKYKPSASGARRDAGEHRAYTRMAQRAVRQHGAYP